jgi:hypothetical protein
VQKQQPQEIRMLGHVNIYKTLMQDVTARFEESARTSLTKIRLT